MKTNTDLSSYIDSLNSKGYSPNTLYSYTKSINRFKKWLNGRGINNFARVSEDDICKYQARLKEQYSESTASTHIRTVKAFYKWLYKELKVFSDPTESLSEIPKAKPLPKILSQNTITEFFDKLPTTGNHCKRDRAMLELCYSSLLRREELSILGVDDLCFKTNTVRVQRKGKKEGLLPFGSLAREALLDYIENERPKLLKGKTHLDLWVDSRYGKRLTYSACDSVIQAVRRKTGIECSWHTFRRSGATHMIQNGASLVVIQEMLSHSDLKTIEHYLRLNTNDLKSALNKSEFLR